MNAEQFIKAKDSIQGEGWSECGESLSEAMEEYAALKIMEAQPQADNNRKAKCCVLSGGRRVILSHGKPVFQCTHCEGTSPLR
jgi:hypothetical protein